MNLEACAYLASKRKRNPLGKTLNLFDVWLFARAEFLLAVSPAQTQLLQSVVSAVSSEILQMRLATNSQCRDLGQTDNCPM